VTLFGVCHKNASASFDCKMQCWNLRSGAIDFHENGDTMTQSIFSCNQIYFLKGVKGIEQCLLFYGQRKTQQNFRSYTALEMR
jgi:hypothetical protein